MRHGLKRSFLTIIVISSLMASQGLCHAMMLASEAPPCHSGTAKADCCDVSSKPEQAEMRCCPKPASETKAFLVQNPFMPESFSPTIRSIASERPLLYSIPQADQPGQFFTSYVLQTAYSYHSPPLFG